MKKAKDIDYVEAQSLALAAESVAEKLLKEYDGDISAIEKTLGHKTRKNDFCFENEVLWAAQWLNNARNAQ